MEYTTEAAQAFVGKRVVVSLRECAADGTETFSGFWGIIDSAHARGIVLAVEGGDIEGFWIMPPDLEALEPAELAEYHFRDAGEPVTNVDYVAKFSVAESPDEHSARKPDKGNPVGSKFAQNARRIARRIAATSWWRQPK